MIDAEIPSDERASPGRGNTDSLQNKGWSRLAHTHHRPLYYCKELSKSWIQWQKWIKSSPDSV